MIIAHPDRIDPRCKSEPMTDRDMIDLWASGEPMSSIAAKARRRNGLTVGEVREIVLGRPN